ncbi:unnamed protein product [Angiostrongylus costaricensis]|uniref:G_PROTEIN_RECEP_F1_2 domain-containing protein n=1 Tax=Angiostrongylus costaricensis TaxID=334426 RepID=A0A158PCY8_ANGCS|nr:unnamed protein product [Angiostrongylus costaricensis]
MGDVLFKSLDVFSSDMPWYHCVGSKSRAYCHSTQRDCRSVKPFGYLPSLYQRRYYNVDVFTAQLSNELRSVNLTDTIPLVHYNDAIVITTLTTIIFIFQAMVHAETRNAFVLQMAQGDFNVFSQTYLNLNNYTVKANRASSKIYAIFMGSLEAYGDLYPPLIFILSLFGTVSAISSKDCYLFQVSLATNVLPMTALVVLLCELFVIVFFYGIRRLFSNVATMVTSGTRRHSQIKMTDYLLNLLMAALWIGVIPIALSPAEPILNMQCNWERGQKRDGKKHGDEDRISAGDFKKIRKGCEGGKKSKRDEQKKASPSKQGRKSEGRLEGGKINVDRQNREKLDENHVSRGQNKKSYGRKGHRLSGEGMSGESCSRERHGRHRAGGEVVSGESHSREGYSRNRTSGEALSRESYSRKRSREEKRHKKASRDSQDNEGEE